VQPGRIRVGIGGWAYDGWRGSFYPKGLPQTRELQHASRRLTAIEVNATFYRTFKPTTFRKWHDEVPGDFVFSLKAPRFAVNRRELATAGDAIARFADSGIAELGERLGPILWQLAPTKPLDIADLAAFLELLPAQAGRRGLRHVLEVRHPSFESPEYVSLARQHDVSTVFTDSDEYPSFADPTGDVVYARLMCCRAGIRTGYAPKALDAWAEAARTWASGGVPPGLPRLDESAFAPRKDGRDVFIAFINGAKEKAPAAAEALLARLC
jgi:uncharacterized protein YecE (DUF72 family)